MLNCFPKIGCNFRPQRESDASVLIMFSNPWIDYFKKRWIQASFAPRANLEASAIYSWNLQQPHELCHVKGILHPKCSWTPLPIHAISQCIWTLVNLHTSQNQGFNFMLDFIIPVHAALNKHISCHMVFYVTVETFLMTLMNCLRILWAWFDLRSCAGGIGWSSGSWVGRSLAFSLFAQSSRSSGGLAFNMGSLVLENRHELCC